MFSIKRPDPPHDSSDDDADFKNSRARKISKVDDCENDAALARALENPKEDEQTVQHAEHHEEMKLGSDDKKIKTVDEDDEDTDNALKEFDPEGTYAICCTNCM